MITEDTPKPAELPDPDTHCWDDDTGKDVWSYSPGLMRATIDAAVAKERERCAKKPMTDQNLDRLIEAFAGANELTDDEYMAMVFYARSIERAHGIVA